MIYAVANSENFAKLNQMMRIKNSGHMENRIATIMYTENKLYFSFTHIYDTIGTQDFKFESDDFSFTQCIDYIYETMSGTEYTNYFMIGLV